MEINSSMEWNETLLKMAKPNIYRINAFRILNIPVTASPKEIQSHVRRLDLNEKYANVKPQEDKDGSLSILRDHDARHDSLQRLADPELRFIDEFFWFWPLSLTTTEENDPLLEIQRNNFSNAISIWKNHEAQGSEYNVSMHNLAVYYHAAALDVEYLESKKKSISKQQVNQKRAFWEQAFSRWRMLLNDKGFWQRVQERVKELDDPRLTKDTSHRIREGLPKALLSINAMLAVEAAEMDDLTDMSFHLTMMQQSGFDSAIISDVVHRAVMPIRDRLNAICVHAREEIEVAPEIGCQTATNLIDNTSVLLSNLDMLLPEGDATREAAHDKVALQVRSCLISYINEKEDWRNTLELSEKALEISSSESVKNKIRDDVEAIRSNLEYSTCWFCGKASAKNESVATVMMHGNVQRDRGFFETKVRYQKLPVPVPRCRSCKSAHSLRKNLGCAGPIVGLVLAVFIGIATQNGWAGFIVFGACWLLGYLISVLAFPKGVKAESYKNQFRMVRKMQSLGWKIGDSP